MLAFSRSLDDVTLGATTCISPCFTHFHRGRVRTVAPDEIGEVPSVSNPAFNIEDSRALPAVFHRYRPEIGAALRKGLSDDPLPIYQMLRYSMGWSDMFGNPITATEGKALRPTLCLLACEATGTPAKTAMPAAVSLEFIHDFSLIHDEIQDLDDVRHHRPTLWVIWGKAKALVAGNALRAIADQSLQCLLDGGLSPRAALDINALLTAAYLEMIEGQYLDLYFEGRTDIELPEYMGMIARKTGALIRCSLVIGATIGTLDTVVIEAFRRFGDSLGLVFQVRDDLLGVWGEEESTGKPVGADLRRKKNTFPVVYTMSKARDRDRDILRQIYSQETVSDQDVAIALEIMESVGARSYAQDLASEHCERAISALSTVELDHRAMKDFREIANFLLIREH